MKKHAYVNENRVRAQAVASPALLWRAPCETDAGRDAV